MTWKPEGYTSLAPYLIVPDPDGVLAFCEAAFGAERLRVIREGDRVVHAECRIDDTVLMIGGADGPPAHLHLYLPDPDAAFARAVEAGAKEVQPVQDQGDGDRRGGLQSRDGTTWWLARQV
ncbi:glyoxalase/bleomycin resistance/extradiol dioxygenase family protein [Hasllibacter sp. MH4015]|uniref:VOC family protein n=1 Tax=Hasllibacter sp. MH4015 TaxID=2854029 RepID=UPI001CD7042B|nr:VOC family protein [Hasllibacter sp. MH4015]